MEDSRPTFRKESHPSTTNPHFLCSQLHKKFVTFALYFRCDVIRSPNSRVRQLSIPLVILLIDLIPLRFAYAGLCVSLQVVCQLLGPDFCVLAQPKI